MYIVCMNLIKHPFWISLIACTPMAAGPPPTQIPVGFKQEFGSSFGSGVQITDQEVPPLFLEKSLWYRKSVGDKSEFHLLGGGAWNGDPIFYGAVGFRRYFVTADGGEFGIDAKFGGPFYMEIGLPLQKQVTNTIWLTTHPSVGLNGFGTVHLPIGLNWKPKDKWFINTSLGTRFLNENPQLIYWNGGVSIPF